MIAITTLPWNTWILWLSAIVHVSIQLLLALRVLMRRRSVGETLAWILILFVFPLGGIIAYLLVGELRLGQRRVRRFEDLFPPFREWLAGLAARRKTRWYESEAAFEPLSRLAQLSIGLPPMPGNAIELIGDWQSVFDRLIEDINAAQSTCHLEFYIWHLGGRVEDVAEALINASRRGVTCRILVDALGSRAFLQSTLAERFEREGVQIVPALMGGLLRLPFVRFDIRLHRKIVVIDGKVAYTGSLNLVDPRYFKKEAGVGQWIDAMVRLEGPAVEALAITFLADWYVESEDTLEQLQETGDARRQPHVGESTIQVLPSGPAFRSEAIEQVLIMAIYAAQREIVLTTPYFVPSESLRMAIESAAMRGVKVILIVPARVDSLLVRFASQAFKGDLLHAGVRVAYFTEGLLHTKSVTIDGVMSLFGSLNLDPRSFRVNFEITLAIYNGEFTRELRALQQTYIDRSHLIDLEQWRRRPFRQRFAENVARLFGPVL